MHNPLFVLIPGMDGTGKLFKPLIEVCAGKFELQVTTYPQSSDASFVDIVEHIRQQIPSGRDVVLVAESFGGPIAIRLLSLGLKVEGCVFCATFSSAPRVTLLGLSKYVPLAKLRALHVPKSIVRHLLLGSSADSAAVALVQKTIHSLQPTTIKHRLQLLSELDLQAELDSLPDIPYLFLQPSKDWLVPKHCADVFVERIKSISVKPITGGHFLLQANPRDCWHQIEVFFNCVLEGK